MPKYRRLNQQELNELQKEFVEFLVINGITAEQWQSIKKNHPEEAEKTIDLFSDVVLEASLRKISHLKKIEGNEQFFFKFDAKKIYLIVTSKVEDKTQIKRLEKPYSKSREAEIFFHLQQGCEIDHHATFDKLN